MIFYLFLQTISSVFHYHVIKSKQKKVKVAVTNSGLHSKVKAKCLTFNQFNES